MAAMWSLVRKLGTKYSALQNSPPLFGNHQSLKAPLVLHRQYSKLPHEFNKQFASIQTREIIDLRPKMGPIRDQGDTAQCWAIAATTFVEGVHRCRTGREIILSPQSVIEGLGRGGEPEIPYYTWRALQHMRSKGAYLEEDWPFKAKRPRNYSAERVYLNGFKSIRGEKAIQEALDRKLPVLCCVAAHQSLASYKRGILDTQEFYGFKCLTCREPVWSWCDECGYGEGFHVMVLVGYGTFEGIPYYRAQNSSGKDYGENGFVRILMGKNMLRIGDEAWIPLPVV